jgi:hypothetical protein
MAYTRCECRTGDVPHTGKAAHLVTKGHRLPVRRCTRAATVTLRRVVKTNGAPIPPRDRTGYDYCAACADAIERYQGGEVERFARR